MNEEVHLQLYQKPNIKEFLSRVKAWNGQVVRGKIMGYANWQGREKSRGEDLARRPPRAKVDGHAED